LKAITKEFQKPLDFLTASIRLQASDFWTLQKKYKEIIAMALEAKL
jgi:hypothetical protein